MNDSTSGTPLTQGQQSIYDRAQRNTAASLEGKSPAFLAAYQHTVTSNGNRRVTGPATRSGGPGASVAGPVSAQYLAGQHQRQMREEVSQWHDHETGTARYVNTPAGQVSAESDPAGFLRAHGLTVVNAHGEEVTPSAGQARGLVGAYIDRVEREAVSTAQGVGSVSYSDPNMPPGTRTVMARRTV